MAGLHADKVQSGEYKVVLHRDVAGSLLSPFDSVFSADLAPKGMSLLQGREGEILGSAAPTILADPLKPASPAATPSATQRVAPPPAPPGPRLAAQALL